MLGLGLELGISCKNMLTIDVADHATEQHIPNGIVTFWVHWHVFFYIFIPRPVVVGTCKKIKKEKSVG